MQCIARSSGGGASVLQPRHRRSWVKRKSLGLLYFHSLSVFHAYFFVLIGFCFFQGFIQRVLSTLSTRVVNSKLPLFPVALRTEIDLSSHRLTRAVRADAQ